MLRARDVHCFLSFTTSNCRIFCYRVTATCFPFFPFFLSAFHSQLSLRTPVGSRKIETTRGALQVDARISEGVHVRYCGEDFLKMPPLIKFFRANFFTERLRKSVKSDENARNDDAQRTLRTVRTYRAPRRWYAKCRPVRSSRPV